MTSTRERVLACLKLHKGTALCAKCIAEKINANIKSVYEAIRYVASPIRVRLFGVTVEPGKCGGGCGALRTVAHMPRS